MAAVFIIANNYYEIKDELQKIDEEAKKTREAITHLDAIETSREFNSLSELTDFEPCYN